MDNKLDIKAFLDKDEQKGLLSSGSPVVRLAHGADR